MTRTSRRDYAKAVRQRYVHASRSTKAHILDEFCATTGYHRKYAIALLTAPSRPQPQGRRRTPIYRSSTVTALAAIWEAAGCPWSARLKALLPLWLPWATHHLALTPHVEQQLRTISPSTIDRRLQSRKRRLKRRLADSAEFEHPVRGDSERPFRELPITQSRESGHRRSAATSRRFGDTSPPLRVGYVISSGTSRCPGSQSAVSPW